MKLNERIIHAAIEEFSSKGLKLTMDDIAKNLHISKKTLYNVYNNKEDVFLAVADYCFKEIKESEQRIAEDPELTTIEKLKQVMIVLPGRYQNIGLSSLYQLKDKYPAVYTRVEHYLGSDWDLTIALLKKGMDEGVIRPISIPIFKAMFESTLESFFKDQVLIDNHISYEEAMTEMINLLLNGIKA